MPNKTAPAISSTLYLGLLFAQEAAGGTLIKGRYGRVMEDITIVERGADDCGCIHGAASFYGGSARGRDGRLELRDAGIDEAAFDVKAFARMVRCEPVTVDSTLLDCGVEVKE